MASILALSFSLDLTNIATSSSRRRTPVRLGFATENTSLGVGLDGLCSREAPLKTLRPGLFLASGTIALLPPFELASTSFPGLWVSALCLKSGLFNLEEAAPGNFQKNGVRLLEGNASRAKETTGDICTALIEGTAAPYPAHPRVEDQLRLQGYKWPARYSVHRGQTFRRAQCQSVS